jgi:hypothetical protein
VIEYYFNFVVRNHIKKRKEKNPFGGQARANHTANDLHALNDGVVVPLANVLAIGLAHTIIN